MTTVPVNVEDETQPSDAATVMELYETAPEDRTVSEGPMAARK